MSLAAVRLSWPVSDGSVVVRHAPSGWVWERKGPDGRTVGDQHGPFASIMDATIDARSLNRERRAG